MSLWKNELFPHCLLKDYAASEKEINETIHPYKPWESRIQKSEKSWHPTLCLNDCKEVNEKMDENIKAKLDNYMELF